jgi:hypothetical protein
MPFAIPPHFCPIYDPDIQVPSELADCKCLMTAGQLAEDGHSAFCLGRIREYTLEVSGIVHSNDLCLCVWAPTIEDEEFRIVSHAINENDMEWLHLLLHAGLGIGGGEEENKYATGIGSDLDREFIGREGSGEVEDT